MYCLKRDLGAPLTNWASYLFWYVASVMHSCIFTQSLLRDGKKENNVLMDRGGLTQLCKQLDDDPMVSEISKTL